MKTHFQKSFYLLFFIFLMGRMDASAQSSHSYFWDAAFEVAFSSDSLWSHSFEIGSRGLFQERADGTKVEDGRYEHLELQHFTGYLLTEQMAVSLGVRYRFKDMFNEREYDEFRLMQQLDYSIQAAFFEWKHQGRFEQRFRGPETVFRFRYELGVEKPLSEVFALEASTEALYSVSAQAKPEAEQRFALQLVNSSFDAVEVDLGVEYRMEDYARDLGHEYFLFTGVSLEL